jgi:hypothetical protein
VSNLEPFWDRYLALQAKLKDSTVVDDTSWGREAALNQLLESGPPATADDIERAAASASRRERYRARLRRHHVVIDQGADLKDVLQAREQLRIVKTTVTPEDWQLLHEVSEGVSYHDLAVAKRTSANALRARVCRVRQKLDRVAA